MFKDMNIKKVSLWLFIIMVLAFTIAATIFFQTGGYSSAASGHNIDETKTFALNGISEIQIGSVSVDININPVDSKVVTAHFYGDSSASKTNKYPKLTGKIENNKIIIKIEEPLTIGFNFRFINNLKLDVSIPKAYAEDLSINTTSGETYIGNFTLNSFQNHSVSGNLVTEKLNSKNSKISSVSGEIKLRDFTGDLTTHSVSGDLNVSYTNFDNNINVGTTSGETKITLPENAQFNIDFNSVSGDIDCNFPIASNGKHSRKGLIGSVGSSSNEIKVSSVSGDLNIDR